MDGFVINLEPTYIWWNNLVYVSNRRSLVSAGSFRVIIHLVKCCLRNRNGNGSSNFLYRKSAVVLWEPVRGHVFPWCRTISIRHSAVRKRFLQYGDMKKSYVLLVYDDISLYSNSQDNGQWQRKGISIKSGSKYGYSSLSVNTMFQRKSLFMLLVIIIPIFVFWIAEYSCLLDIPRNGRKNYPTQWQCC